MQFKRRDEVGANGQREGLRAQHAALEELKRQLAERVDAVRERELELHHALAEAGGTRGPARSSSQASVIAGAGADTGGALDADRRERALSERERALDAREELIAKQERELRARADQTAPAPPPRSDDAKLAAIEARLVELRNAEKLFLRTRDELASRSEAVRAGAPGRTEGARARRPRGREGPLGAPAGSLGDGSPSSSPRTAAAAR